MHDTVKRSEPRRLGDSKFQQNFKQKQKTNEIKCLDGFLNDMGGSRRYKQVTQTHLVPLTPGHYNTFVKVCASSFYFLCLQVITERFLPFFPSLTWQKSTFCLHQTKWKDKSQPDKTFFFISHFPYLSFKFGIFVYFLKTSVLIK